jgi:UDP-N-acetylmuramate dehydrogenase
MTQPPPPARSFTARVAADAPLAPLCTLELGGPARHLVDADGDATVGEALRWAHAEHLSVFILGGGSNVVIADRGFDGLVLRMAQRGVTVERTAERVLVTARAAEPCDTLVDRAVAEGWAGIECLSGIPGTVGATPIQNVGAYGQEVAETVAAVRVLERSTLVERELTPAECGFAYRDSVFRRQPERFVILAVTFSLRPGAAPTLRYPELARALGSAHAPSLADVRQAVLALRRSRSMVLDPSDENRRSVGSFFVNPVLPERQAAKIAAGALAAGLVRDLQELPRFAAGYDRVKVPAARLIELAGFAKGLRRGHVGISSRHVLALVHHGGGTTAELVALGRDIRAAVAGRFGVNLEPEPRFVGFAAPDPLAA